MFLMMASVAAYKIIVDFALGEYKRLPTTEKMDDRKTEWLSISGTE
jgi:hypothetical protein